MKPALPLRSLAVAAAFSAAVAWAQESATPIPADNGTLTVYRHVLPDGRIIYADKAMQGMTVDHTITIAPPIKGNLWSTESAPKPVLPQQVERTPVNRVSSIPAPGKRKTLEDASSDVIRAEMFLEDAKKRQEAGAEPLPGERMAASTGGTRFSNVYEVRQRSLEREVAEAKAVLKKALAERDALRRGR